MRRVQWCRVVGGICVGVLLCAKLIAQTNTFPPSGNVGIGTTSPQFALDVSGQARLQSTANVDLGSLGSDNAIYIRSSQYSVSNGFSGQGLSNVNDTANGASLGYVAKFSAGWTATSTINRTTGFVAGTYDVYVRIRTDGTGNSTSGVEWGLYDYTTSTYPLSAWTPLTTAYQELYLGRLTISSASLGDSIETYFSVSGVTTNYYLDYVKLVKAPLFVGGNVGIGTTTPQALLDVNGSVRISGSGASLTFADGTVQSTAYSGTCTATGGDYAESVDVSGDKSGYEPGDVIVLDPASAKHFLLSSQPYSTLVAGIYSTKPGYVGRRQKGDPRAATTEIPMAMIGVVPTKVTTENGPIKIGDLLVTSTKPGYVMKGTDRSQMIGSVVGKAMEALDKGTGVIEVLVSLQ